MSTDPMNPNQPDQASRLMQELDRQRLDRPKTENVADLIRYHARAEHLDIPLFTAKAQEDVHKLAKALKEAKTQPQKSGEKLTTKDLKPFTPMIFDQIDNYEELAKYLSQCKLPKSDLERVNDLLNKLLEMKRQGQLSPEELKSLTEMIEMMNDELAKNLDPKEQQQYWSLVANMYEDVEKKSKKLASEAPTAAGKKLGKKLQKQASEDKGAAKAKQHGHETLAQMFIDAILGKFMPHAESDLTAIALLLSFQNYGATVLDDLLGGIADFGAAANTFDLNTLLTGGQPGTPSTNTKYPDGQDIVNGWNKEVDAIQRSTNELNGLINGIHGKLSEIGQKLKEAENAKPPNQALIKGYKQLQSQLQGQLASCGQALKNLKTLDTALHGMKFTPCDPKTGAPVANADGSIQIDSASMKGISADEDAVVNGDKNGVGGLQSIYNDLKGDQQDYSNQSSQQQMQLQLTMTEVQQMWTVVSTCMTTLNQSAMTLGQAIYK